nr:protein vacuoleless1 [Tanacetum cinerariifolium]
MLKLFQADENLRLICSSLPETAEACVDDAGHEFDPSLQQALVRAASYGQAFCRIFYAGSGYHALGLLKVNSVILDPTLLEILLDKLKLCRGISSTAVAAHADQTGRRKLAAMLVEHEPFSSKQEKENGKQVSKSICFERSMELHKIQHLSTTRGLY